MYKFIKWPSLTNVNKLTQLNIDTISNNYKNCTWLVTEKIDGTNFSITITEDSYKIGRRNGYLEENENFFNIQNNIHQLDDLIDTLKKYYFNYNSFNFTIYGEYFGPKIFNRVNYGTDYQFRIFSVRNNIANIWFMPRFLELIESITPYLVPKLDTNYHFQSAINYPNDNNSTILSIDNNTMEGIVISPYKYMLDDWEMSNLLFKSKNDKFIETSSKKKPKIYANSQELDIVTDAFISYCTKSRMYSVFSKLGQPKDNSDAGKYIFEFLNDAYEEFKKDNKELTKAFTNKEKKHVMRIGSLGFNLFVEVMKETLN